jgi:hypothetical protein
MIGDFVHQLHSRRDHHGILPVRIQLYSRLLLDGDSPVATGEPPRRSPIVSWLARVQLRISKRLAFEIVHVSNGGSKDISFFS